MNTNTDNLTGKDLIVYTMHRLKGLKAEDCKRIVIKERMQRKRVSCLRLPIFLACKHSSDTSMDSVSTQENMVLEKTLLTDDISNLTGDDLRVFTKSRLNGHSVDQAKSFVVEKRMQRLVDSVSGIFQLHVVQYLRSDSGMRVLSEETNAVVCFLKPTNGDYGDDETIKQHIRYALKTYLQDGMASHYVAIQKPTSNPTNH